LWSESEFAGREMTCRAGLRRAGSPGGAPGNAAISASTLWYFPRSSRLNRVSVASVVATATLNVFDVVR